MMELLLCEKAVVDNDAELLFSENAEADSNADRIFTVEASRRQIFKSSLICTYISYALP